MANFFSGQSKLFSEFSDKLFMNIKNCNTSFLFALCSIAFATACGKHSDSSSSNSTSSTTHSPTTMDIYYLDAQDGNTAVLMSSGTKFPTLPSTANSGYLYLMNYSAGAFNNGYFNFEIRNTGTESLFSSADISVEKTTDTTYHHSGAGAANQYSFAITSQPIFPIVAGGSSTFTLKLTTAGTKKLSSFVDNTTTWYTYESARVIIKTNDSNDPTYNLDINVFGDS